MNEKIFFNSIIVQKEALTIKEITTEEYKSYYNLFNANRDRLRRYFPKTTDKIQSLADAKQYLIDCCQKRKNEELFPFGIYIDNELLGWISVRTIDWEKRKCELGYYIDKVYEGRGISSMSVDGVTKFCFRTLKMKTIFLRIGEDNIGSQKVAKKTGFHCVSILKNNFKNEKGDLIDLLYYELQKKF